MLPKVQWVHNMAGKTMHTISRMVPLDTANIGWISNASNYLKPKGLKPWVKLVSNK